MAPPAIQSLDAFSDTQVRDFYHRHQYQMAPSGNILQKFYNTLGGTTGNLSAAEVVSMNVSTYQGQYDLLLSTTANRLDGNTITTDNAASWTANSMMTVTPGQTTFRSANVRVTSNLETNGTVKLGQRLMQTFQRTLGTAANSTTEICKIEAAFLSYGAQLSVVHNDTNVQAFAKEYMFCVGFGAKTGTGVWHKLLPLSTTNEGGATSGDFSVEIQNDSGFTFLRLIRAVTGGSSTAMFECSLRLNTSGGNPVTITPQSVEGTGTQATKLFKNTTICQVGLGVGINTDNLAVGQILDVRGNTAITGLLAVTGNTNITTSTGAYRIGGTDVLTSTALGTGVTTSSLTSIGTLNSLSVNGLIQAGQLNVTGDINLDANTFKLDSTNNRVGIVNDTPSYTLDVGGDAHLAKDNVYRINAKSVLSETTLGSSVMLSSLTTVGTLGNVTVATDGLTKLDTRLIRTFQRSLGTATNQSIEICSIQGISAAFGAELTVAETGGLATSQAKTYVFACGNGTQTDWRRLLPLTTAHPAVPTNNNFIVEIKYVSSSNGIVTLRLVRTATSDFTTNVGCVLRVNHGRNNSLSITPLIGTPTVTTPSTTPWFSTLLTQMNGNVGIGTDNPQYSLDVVGVGNFRGNVISGNIMVAGTANVSILKATALDIANLSTAGNVRAGGVSTFTLADSSTFNFSDKIRLRYNTDEDQLEVQRNTAGTWNTTAILAA